MLARFAEDAAGRWLPWACVFGHDRGLGRLRHRILPKVIHNHPQLVYRLDDTPAPRGRGLVYRGQGGKLATLTKGCGDESGE